MTVKELKKAIANLPEEMEVVLQQDSEGNGYSPLSYVEANAIYIAETNECGDVYFTDWTAGDAGVTAKEWKKIKSRPRTLILAPVL